MAFVTKTLSVVVMGTLLASTALAEELGEEEYMNSCASCHGARADGDGPLSQLMTVKVPALTGLSADNDGKFPMLDVIQTIDGRSGVKGHGYPMPVWGKRFKDDVKSPGPYGAEAILRGRILSLAYYLETIQK